MSWEGSSWSCPSSSLIVVVLWQCSWCAKAQSPSWYIVSVSSSNTDCDMPVEAPAASWLPTIQITPAWTALTLRCRGVGCQGPFRVFSMKKRARCVFHCFSCSSSIIELVATKQLCRPAIRTNTPCGVRYVACHVQVALLLSFLAPPWSQWCSDWCALCCPAAVGFGCVCLSHVSGSVRLVEVFAAVPLGVSLLSVVSGRAR